jgi:CBS domain-containing protein
MQVCEIMSRDVQTIGSGESLFEAAQKMRSSDAGVLPVTASDGKVLGILTDRDIVVRAVAEGADAKAVSVGEAMSGDPVMRNAVSASISECPRLARGMVTLVATSALHTLFPVLQRRRSRRWRTGKKRIRCIRL